MADKKSAKSNPTSRNSIRIRGNVEGSNIISGDHNAVTQKIQNRFNKAESADIQADLKETLKQLATADRSVAESTLPTDGRNNQVAK